MENLRVLSLGRNCIKKIENLDGIAETLEELWMSYNLVERLAGVEKLSNIRVLYLGNNKVRDWAEVERLAALEKLEDLLLRGCPIHDDAGAVATYRVEVGSVVCLKQTSIGQGFGQLMWMNAIVVQVIKRVPQLKKLDGIPVDVDEREAAAAA